MNAQFLIQLSAVKWEHIKQTVNPEFWFNRKERMSYLSKSTCVTKIPMWLFHLLWRDGICRLAGRQDEKWAGNYFTGLKSLLLLRESVLFSKHAEGCCQLNVVISILVTFLTMSQPFVKKIKPSGLSKVSYLDSVPRHLQPKAPYYQIQIPLNQLNSLPFYGVSMLWNYFALYWTDTLSYEIDSQIAKGRKTNRCCSADEVLRGDLWDRCFALNGTLHTSGIHVEWFFFVCNTGTRLPDINRPTEKQRPKHCWRSVSDIACVTRQTFRITLE